MVRIRVRGSFLHIAQWHPGVEGGGERVPQRVGTDGLGESGAAGDPADDGRRRVGPAAARQELGNRAVAAFPDGEVDGSGGARGERDGDDFVALAGDNQGPVPALQSQVLDVSAGRFGDPQPIQGEQRDQRVLTGRAEACGDQQGAELVAVQADRVRLVVQPGRRTCAAGEWSSSSSSTVYL